MDTKYVISGSDNGNAPSRQVNVSDRSTIRTARERQKFQYNKYLKEPFEPMSEIGRIARRRHVLQAIQYESKRIQMEIAALKRKKTNLQGHSTKMRLIFSQIPVIEALANSCHHHASRIVVFFLLFTPSNFSCRESLCLFQYGHFHSWKPTPL